MSGTSGEGELPGGKRKRSRAWLQRALELGISAVCLWLALRSIDFQALWAALQQARWIWVIPAILGITAMALIKAKRWQILFLPEHEVPYGSVFTAQSAGYLASNVFPGRVGEIVRLVLLASEQPVGAARVLSTIVVERLLDILSCLGVLVLLLPFVELPPLIMRSAYALGIGALAASAVIVLLSFWKTRVLGWSHAVLRHIRFLDRPGVYTAIEHLIDGFAALRGPRGPALIALSFAAWAAVIAEGWSVRMAVQSDAPLTSIVFAVVVTSLGMIAPSSPGYVGVFHFLVVESLRPFGIAQTEAMSIALIWHGVNYIVLSLMGLIMLWVHGTSLGQVVEKWRARKTPIDHEVESVTEP
ncbi:MAG: flippase-like domain-containing protein [Anaerolineae bacterium]|nr:flippase-like domain-containing protein [Anaerolineae bacterium]